MVPSSLEKTLMVALAFGLSLVRSVGFTTNVKPSTFSVHLSLLLGIQIGASNLVVPQIKSFLVQANVLCP